MLRVAHKVRASSPAFVRHLLKAPQRRRGKCDGPGIAGIADERTRAAPSAPRGTHTLPTCVAWGPDLMYM